MLSMQIYLSHFSPSRLIHLLAVVMFFSGTTLGYMSIYVSYFYNHILHQGSNTFPQCSDPDEFIPAMPVVLPPYL